MCLILSCAEKKLELLYPSIRYKMASALNNWHPSDTSAHIILKPWIQVRCGYIPLPSPPCIIVTIIIIHPPLCPTLSLGCICAYLSAAPPGCLTHPNLSLSLSLCCCHTLSHPSLCVVTPHPLPSLSLSLCCYTTPPPISLSLCAVTPHPLPSLSLCVVTLHPLLSLSLSVCCYTTPSPISLSLCVVTTMPSPIGIYPPSDGVFCGSDYSS